MLLSQIFPSKYLKAADIGDRQVLVTIDAITIEEIDDDDHAIRKPVVYFQGKEKGLVLNITNGKAIAALYGEETDDWIGREVILYSRMVDFKGNEVPGLRVKAPVRAMREVNSPPLHQQHIERDTLPVAPVRQSVQPARRATVTADLNDEVPF